MVYLVKKNCCFGFLLYIHFVLAINYKTIQPTFSLICWFSKICFQLIHGSPDFLWLNTCNFRLSWNRAVKCWRFCRKLQLSTYILHNKYRNNKRLLLDSGMILNCSNNNYIKHHWHDMFNWQLITHITRAHGQIHTQLFINMTYTMMK